MRASRQKGFTLVEVLASILLLAGCIIPLILCTVDALQTSREIEQRVKSVLLAEREMEKIKGALRQSFETDFTSWPAEIDSRYLADRTATEASSTLKIAQVSVGYDVNSDSVLAAEEIMVTLVTQNVKRN
jgi:prepilin-type N-terminal cleavage/methylation domain-containing protein